MWDLFIALFGGAYLAIKIFSERKASRKIDEQRQAAEAWRAAVIDDSLEEKTNSFVFSHPIDAAQRANVVCPCIPEDQHNDATYRRILLARYGKISRLDTSFGIATPSYLPYPVEKARRQYQEYYRFVVWLKAFLEKNGAPKCDMVFNPAYPKSEQPSHPVPLYDISSGELWQEGTYVWRPQETTEYK